MTAVIHDSVIIHPSSHVADDVELGPWTVIGPNVRIGAGCKIGSHVVIKENTLLGQHNVVHAFASLGGDPQTKNYNGANTSLVIGDNNVFHEYCTINRGDLDGASVTRIGDHNLFMTSVHVAHDCVIGNHAIFVNNTALAGHVEIQDYAVLSAFVAVHQFCTVGTSCFLTKGCLVTKDVVPYMIVTGNPPRVRGLNKIGLRRRDFDAAAMEILKKVHKIIFSDETLTSESLGKLRELANQSAIVQPVYDMLAATTRGIVR